VWEHVEETALHLMVDRKQRVRKGMGPVLTFEGTLPLTYFFHLGATARISTAS
jgi:hypothetical protein